MLYLFLFFFPVEWVKGKGCPKSVPCAVHCELVVVAFAAASSGAEAAHRLS